MTDLPTGWRRAVLGDVAETALGKMLDSGKAKGQPNVAYLRNVNVQWGRIDTTDLLTMEIAPEQRERFAVRQGDLLVCEGGEIGRAGVWSRPDTIAYQKALHRIRSNGRIDLHFLRYLLELYSRNGVLEKYATGSTIAHLPQEQLRALPIVLPPMEEQRRIVEILEDHLSRLDAARGLLDAIRVRQLAAYRSAQLEMTVRSAGADFDSLGHLAIGSGYGTSAKCVVGGSGPAVIRIPNLVNGAIDLTSEKRVEDPEVDVRRLMVAPGDLLFVRTNGSRDLIGRTAVVQPGVEAAFASYLIRYRLDELRVSPQWAQMCMEAPSTRAVLEGMAASTAGQYNLAMTKLDQIKIPVPSLDRQRQLLAEGREHLDRAGRLLTALAGAASRGQALRRALLAAAFDGRLTKRTNVAEELVGV